MTRRASSQVFVGRRAELDLLDEMFDRASLGQPSLVLVAGEAGVGKSRLVSESSARAAAAGATTVTGGCLDVGEGGLPYAPFVEALRTLARGLDSETRQAAFGPSASVLGTLLPDLRDPGLVAEHRDSPDPAGRLAQLFDAVIATLGRLSHERPLVLILEDLHWADGSTRDLLRFIVRNMRDERLLVVATYRSDDLHRRHPLMPLLTELERADHVERVELRRFDRDELAEQLTSILEEAPAPALIDALLERSDGLPFYVEELVAGTGQVGAGLPATLRDILGLRLATLSPGSTVLVRAAAVIGGRFPHERLAAASGLDEGTLIAALHEAIDARILVPIDGRDGSAYAFRHALLREAAYDELLPAERVNLHFRLADHLDETIRRLSVPDPSIIADFALHAYHAHDQPRALEGSVRAVRAFMNATAYREALGHAERALELWSRVDDADGRAGIHHADLLAVAGRMAAAANRPEQAVTLTQEAIAEFEALGDQVRQAELLVDLHFSAWEARLPEIGAAAAEKAFELAGSGEPTRLRARVMMVLGGQRWSDGRLHESQRLLEEAMAIADAIDDRPTWADIATSLAHTHADLGHGVRASSLVDQSSDAVPEDDRRFDRIVAEIERSIAALQCGRFEDAERFATIGLDLSARYGWEERIGSGFRSSMVDALFELGRYGETEAIAQPVLAGASIHYMIWWMSNTMARVAIAQGRFDKAHEFMDNLGAGNLDWGQEAYTILALVDLARAEGRFATVVSIVDGKLVDLTTREEAFSVWLVLGSAIGASADGAALARRRRRPAEAAAAEAHGERWLDALRAKMEEPRAQGGAGSFGDAILATAEAEMGRAHGAQDVAGWTVVVEACVALSHPYRTAYAGLRLAEAILQANGDRAAAEQSLRDAHGIASAIGAMPLSGQIEAAARDARINLDPVQADRDDAAGGRAALALLTARERGVLQLVAEGHTNREIGDRLFISEKTVSVHVSNAMAKLGALSRYEAAASAEQHGLL